MDDLVQHVKFNFLTIVVRALSVAEILTEDRSRCPDEYNDLDISTVEEVLCKLQPVALKVHRTAAEHKAFRSGAEIGHYRVFEAWDEYSAWQTTMFNKWLSLGEAGMVPAFGYDPTGMKIDADVLEIVKSLDWDRVDIVKFWSGLCRETELKLTVEGRDYARAALNSLRGKTNQ